MQGETTKQVLTHCIKKVETCDQETMMGTDMFAEERQAMNTRITRLESQLKVAGFDMDLLKKEKRELISAKEKMSQEIR